MDLYNYGQLLIPKLKQLNGLQSLRLIRPSSVDGLATKSLTLLECDHVLQLLVVDGVHIAAGLKAQAGLRAASRRAIHGWNVNRLAGVELERWLCAQSLEVDLAAGVVHLD